MNMYDKLYEVNGINYGNVRGEGEWVSEREVEVFKVTQQVLEKYKISNDAVVLEIGASLGYNHHCHPNYLGIEYSQVAVSAAKARFGASLNIQQGDCSKLIIDSESIDFLFTHATLEHIPKIEEALEEISRVLKRDGIGYLAPAWNCRIWTVEKLPCISYSELNIVKKIEKLFIPVRESLAYRFMWSLPKRIFDEVKMCIDLKCKLQFKTLPVDYKLIERLGHVADDDAYVSLDAHSAMTWFRSRSFMILSHPTFLSRILCRGEAVIVKKLNKNVTV